jgi:hypothetical protein
MNQESSPIGRRDLLKVAAGLAVAHAAAVKPSPTGKPGDFDFLTGEWKIKNRRFRDNAWDSFDGEATVHAILAGIGSVEELRIPARNFSGLGLRLLDVERKLWADFFVNAKSGVLTPPPAWGSFVEGVGTWQSESKDGDKPILVRGVWDQITAKSCRWFQAVSRDDGQTWQENWIMHWTRA